MSFISPSLPLCFHSFPFHGTSRTGTMREGDKRGGKLGITDHSGERQSSHEQRKTRKKTAWWVGSHGGGRHVRQELNEQTEREKVPVLTLYAHFCLTLTLNKGFLIQRNPLKICKTCWLHFQTCLNHLIRLLLILSNDYKNAPEEEKPVISNQPIHSF